MSPAPLTNQDSLGPDFNEEPVFLTPVGAGELATAAQLFATNTHFLPLMSVTGFLHVGKQAQSGGLHNASNQFGVLFAQN